MRAAATIVTRVKRLVTLLGGVLLAMAGAGACGGGAPFEAKAGGGTSSGQGGSANSGAGSAAAGNAGEPTHAGGAAEGQAGQPSEATCTQDEECGADESKCAHHACIDAVCVIQTLPEGGPCEHGTCDGEHHCAVSTCDSGEQDGDETGVDCGGSCELCPDGQGCSSAMDCLSGVCQAEHCQASTCSDGTQNGAETGVDCGGMCPLRCSLNQGCATAKDCAVAAGDLAESVRCLDSVCTSTKPPADGGAPRYWQDFAPERLVNGPESCSATDKLCLVGNGSSYAMSGIGTNGLYRPVTKALLFTAAGAVGGAGKFDGTLCMTRPGTDLSFLNQGAITGMAWVKTTRAKAPWESAIIGGFNHYFLALDANPASRRFLTALATTQAAAFDYRSAAGLGSIKAGEWHHVAAVYSTTAGKLSQYVDGKPVQSFDLSGTTSTTPVSVFIGCRKDAATAGQFFIGSLDEIVMYPRAVLESELTDYVRRTKPAP